MSKILISTINKAIKILLIFLILFFIYYENQEIKLLNQKNDQVIQQINQQKHKLKLLKQMILLYQNNEYIYPYMIRTYGLLDKNDYKLYIMEVKN